ncbi:hypothetical protein HNR62_000303 [Oceanisphaera litoralis]|uniref:portal protein n=1 Tax=Oceanisphaera litoralis TaxID=225144 RepID=UPI00195B8E46|nr:hypothetical protein [Oceanisphaera litoralis]MBM7454474.1 hypothetical protein [Oceanisphaera litoralis]
MNQHSEDALARLDQDAMSKARRNQEQFRLAYDAGHEKYVALGRKCNDFYRGDQWNEGDRSKLDGEGRPALTLNLVLSTVNAILGEQMDRRMEVRYSPRKHGTGEVAFELNQLTRYILGLNDFESTEDTVFADGVITGRGYYDLRVSYDDNLFGEVAITHEDPVDVIPDPEARDLDPATWNEVFISRWMTPDEIAVQYGEQKAEELRVIAENGFSGDEKDMEFHKSTFGGEDLAGDHRKLRRVRVIERQYFTMTKALHWVDPEMGDFRLVPAHVEPEAAEAMAEQHNLLVMEKLVRRVKMTVSADQVLLFDDWSPYRTFTIIPFYPYFRRGKPFGVVENLLDPQELLNKTSSQELHIVNTTANSGWIVEEGSLANMTEEELEERGAETGLVLVKRKTAAAPEKIQPNSIPTGIDRISQKAAGTIRDVSAVNTAMLGLGRADQSGRAMEAQASRGQVQVSVVLKNLMRCRRMIARKILELVQDFYTDTRFYRVTQEDELTGEPVQEERFINGMDPEGNILNDVTTGQYVADVAFAPVSGSAADQQFAEAMRLREMGVAIPDHILVQYSQLRRRQEVAELLKNLQGFGEPTEEEMAMQQAQSEAAMAKMQAEVQELEAQIAQKQAAAQLSMAKAASLEGHNEAALEIERLEQEKELRLRELSARIALSAQSHHNQRYLNKLRGGTSMALEALKSQLNTTKEKQNVRD